MVVVSWYWPSPEKRCRSTVQAPGFGKGKLHAAKLLALSFLQSKSLVETPAAISNQGHVRILFEARGNANSFLCTLDGQTSQCVSPFEADVADGEHAFSVAAALNANVDESPATHAWRVDTVAPDTTITSAPAVLDNSVSPEFVFAASESDVRVRTRRRGVRAVRPAVHAVRPRRRQVCRACRMRPATSIRRRCTAG
jgi:hypothetical protein